LKNRELSQIKNFGERKERKKRKKEERKKRKKEERKKKERRKKKLVAHKDLELDLALNISF